MHRMTQQFSYREMKAVFEFGGVAFSLLVVSKTEEEIQELLSRKEVQLKEKAERRKQQEQNVAVKKEKREKNKYFLTWKLELPTLAWCLRYYVLQQEEKPGGYEEEAFCS